MLEAWSIECKETDSLEVEKNEETELPKLKAGMISESRRRRSLVGWLNFMVYQPLLVI